MGYPVHYVPAGDVLPIFFDSFDGGTGASITMSGLAVTDIEIYKDGSATQRASDAGYTLLDTDGIDFDGLTGIHGFSIDTGDNTDAGFYTVGAWFHVVVSAVTIDAQTVSFIAAAFRIMAAEGVAGVPDVNTTHISDTAQTGNDVGADVNDILTDTGTTLQGELDGIQADTEDIQARLPAALVSGRIDATVDGTGMEAAAVAAIADGVWDEAATGHTDAGKAGEQLWTDVDAILVDTGTTLDGRLPAALVSGRIDASVGAMAANVMTAAAAAADLTTELQSGLSTLDAADVRTALGLASANLDTQLGDLPTNAELATSQAAADDATLAAIAALNNLSSAQAQTAAAAALTAYDPPTKAETDAAALTALTTAMTESYSADGAAPTPAQALFAILQRLTEFSISGTAVTVKKLDGSTTAFVLTLDDASTPTASARSS